MNEIVKYDTDLNKLDYSSLNMREQNIFMTILAKVKNQNANEIGLPYEDIIELAGLKCDRLSDSKKHEIIESTKDKLFNISCDIILVNENNERRSISFHVFDKWDNDESNKLLTLSVSNVFVRFLNNPQKFLSFPLSNFVNLKNNYSKTLYRILKEFDFNGSFIFHSVEQFREQLKIPESMPNKKLTGLINQAVSEINSKGYIKELTYTIVKDTKKKGHPIKSIKFNWIYNA